MTVIFFLKVLGQSSPGFPLKAVVGIMGLVFVLVFGGRTGTKLYLAQFGKPTTAVVTRVSEYIGEKIPGAMLYFTYEVNGRTLKAKQHVRSSAYREGEEVEVMYAPRFPALVSVHPEMTGLRQRRDDVVMGGIGILLSFVGLPGLAGWARRAHALKRLAERGVLRGGKVERVLERPYKLGSIVPVYLEYSFTGIDGKRIVSTSENLPPEAIPNFKVGGKLSVLQDPQNPETYAADVWNLFPTVA